MEQLQEIAKGPADTQPADYDSFKAFIEEQFSLAKERLESAEQTVIEILN